MNQTPQTEKQTGKRIVSKGEYMRGVATVTRMHLEVIGAFCIGFFLALFSIGMLCASFFALFRRDLHTCGICLGISAIQAGMSYGIFDAASSIWKQSQQVDPGIPIHRVNTADLPAPDTLVRASAEPVQEQQTVLLRAATETQERHEEQLVRASAGGTEQI
jgi:hypothetical protein